MVGEDILKKVFDDNMYEEIINFCNNINESVADCYIIMSRKAACFISLLEKHGFLSLNGNIYTDRILDFKELDLNNKRIIVIDDVVVSGTTLYNVINKLKHFGVKSITIKVLGVNKEFFNRHLFDYIENNKEKNYIDSPYQLMSDQTCTYTCSNIASLFALDITPYDVDFPKHDTVFIREEVFNELVLSNLWRSYDVSNTIQSDSRIKNITLLPTASFVEKINDKIGKAFNQLGNFKIRIFALYSDKRKRGYIVNAVPYYIFNAISETQVNDLYALVFKDKKIDTVSPLTKIRILQYFFAEKVFLLWMDLINNNPDKKLDFVLRKSDFNRNFPAHYFQSITELLDKDGLLSNYSYQPVYPENPILQSRAKRIKSIENKTLLQAKLIEPFSDLYFNKELRARNIVKKYGKKAFELKEYQDIFFRLNHGLSFNDLLRILDNYSDIYDKRTTVSLFIDEAIDSGVIVPIIAEEYYSEGKTRYYYRAFRHGEDVPFGEHQEKLCAILLSNYKKFGGIDALSKIRVEKLLVLFLRIGSTQNFFKLNTYDSIYYKVNVDAYLFGNILTTQVISSNRTTHYLTHKTDRNWLTEVLKEKEIIIYDDKEKITDIIDNIEISVDRKTLGQVSAIGKTFGILYKNSKININPQITDDDFIMFSTCLFPQDIINALASELSIFRDRFIKKSNGIQDLIEHRSFNKIKDLLFSNDLYTSINTGQQKYFFFIEKKGLNRIDEISDQLNSSNELSIYGSSWDQFWPSNMDWNTESIHVDVFNTINYEGKLLLVFNVLCRILLLASETNNINKEKLVNQLMSFHTKIKSRPFSKDKDIKRLIDFSSSAIAYSLEENLNNDLMIKTVDSIKYYIKFIPSVLSDVELLVNRHGKINEIIRYKHAICIKLKDNFNTEDNLRHIKRLFLSNKISIQDFPIINPSSKFPEAGLWIYIKGNISQSSINNIIHQMVSSEDQRVKYSYIKIYYNLSDDLRLKIATESNERKNFGIFPSYCDACKNIDISIDELYICWYIQNSKANKIYMSQMTDIVKTGFNKIYKGSLPFETQSSTETNYYVLCFNLARRNTYLLDYYKKELNKMKKKCNVFISYTEDSQEHIERVKKIADCLKNLGMQVYFYDDAFFGTDMVGFMRKIETSDIILIIGTEKYKERAYNNQKSGASFEDRMISDVFMSDHREKIVPIAFGDFNDVIPAPFNKLKGMNMTQPTDDELNLLSRGITNKFLKTIKL